MSLTMSTWSCNCKISMCNMIVVMSPCHLMYKTTHKGLMGNLLATLIKNQIERLSPALVGQKQNSPPSACWVTFICKGDKGSMTLLQGPTPFLLFLPFLPAWVKTPWVVFSGNIHSLVRSNSFVSEVHVNFLNISLQV